MGFFFIHSAGSTIPSSSLCKSSLYRGRGRGVTVHPSSTSSPTPSHESSRIRLAPSLLCFASQKRTGSYSTSKPIFFSPDSFVIGLKTCNYIEFKQTNRQTNEKSLYLPPVLFRRIFESSCEESVLQSPEERKFRKTRIKNNSWNELNGKQ